VFGILNVCTFINTFIEAHSDDSFKVKIKKALKQYGFHLIYEDIKAKIANKEYKSDDCSYSSMI
jgi:hypothetical protein